MKYVLKPTHKCRLLEDAKHNKLAHGFGLTKAKASNPSGTKQSLNKDLRLILSLIGFDEAKNYTIHHRDANHSNNSIDNLYLITRQAHTKIHNTALDLMFEELKEKCPNISEDDLLNLVYKYGDYIKYIKNNPFLSYFSDLKDTLDKTIFKDYDDAVNEIKSLDSQYSDFIIRATDLFNCDSVDSFQNLVNSQLDDNKNYRVKDIFASYTKYNGAKPV